MNPQQFITHIRSLIAEDRLSEALKQLRLLFANSPKLDEALLQTARFQAIRKQIRLGTVSHEDATLTKNQIRAGLMDLLLEMEEQEKTPAIREEMAQAISVINSKNVVVGSTFTASGNIVVGDTTTHVENDTSRRLRVFLYVLVPVLAIASAYGWYQYQEMKRPLSLKVRIENQTPNQELPEPSGALSLTYGQKTDTQYAVSAEALFEGIPAGYGGELLNLQYEAIGYVKIDTLVQLSRDKKVVIPVWRNDALATIEGAVEDEQGQPIEGVKVSIPACCCCFYRQGRRFFAQDSL